METANNQNSSRPLALDGLSDLWAQTAGDPEITVAILDGPCDTKHPSLAQASITQMNFLGSGEINGPASEHGTHTASIIFGQHDSQVKGVAPQCHGLIIPIFRSNTQGGISACSQPDLARAIRAAANAGAHIINVSGGEFSFTGTAHPMLNDVVQECHRQGRLIVAAAGNDGCSCLHVPGALPSVLAVGAMDAGGNPTDFSNWGSQYQASGILAPGVNILGAFPGQKVGVRTGTSFATPVASGVAALLLSLQKAQGQEPKAEAIRAAILESALGCEHSKVPDCQRLLGGRINVSGAVSKIISLSTNYKGGEAMSESSNASDQALVDQQISLVAPSAEIETSAALGTSPVNVKNAQDDSSGGTASMEAYVRSEANVVAAGMGTPTHRVGSPSAVTASECACNGAPADAAGTQVYAIGGLMLDFGTQARMDSFKQNFERFNFSQRKLNVHDSVDVLRHLIGWREWPGMDDKKDRKPYLHSSHLYDAKDLFWVMTHDETPVYAIQPTGSFSEEAYFELTHFFLEMLGFSDDHSPVSHDSGPLNMFYHESIDTDDAKKKGPNPNQNISKSGKIVPIVDRIAIPGKIIGTVRLYNGMDVPVIQPNQRGTLAWKLSALVELHAEFDSSDKSEAGKAKKKKMKNMERIVRRFMEEARNPGLTGRDRALNFAATQSFRLTEELKDTFDVEHDVDLETIFVEPSPTCRKDSECYDVHVAFYDAENILRSKDVLRFTIDVSYEVPVLLGDFQHYRANKVG